MTETSPPTTPPSEAVTHSESTPEPTVVSVHSWAFWKKRLARASVIGGLALLVTQVLPAIPTDQRVVVRAPDGYTISEISLSYAETGTVSPLGGTQLRPAHSSDRVTHTMSLTNGDYDLAISAQLATRGDTDTLFLVQDHRSVTLNGSSQTLYLKPPKSH